MVNALWSGGAEAMTIQGQRVISTTGVKCVGNTVVLHGIPYAPPYVISAIGNPDRLRAALQRFRSRSRSTSSTWRRTGWSISERSEGNGHLPGPRGHARPPVRPSARRTGRPAAPPRDNRPEHLPRWARMGGARGEDPGDRQLRLVRLQPRPVPGPDRRRGRGLAQRRPAVRRSRVRRRASTASCSRPARARPRRPASASTWSRTRAGRLPIFGVCLGLQSIGVAYGGVVDRAPELLHGKTSSVQHTGLGRPRRPALAVHRDPLSLAGHRAGDHARGPRGHGHHRQRCDHGRPAPRTAVEAVQFHPESVLTEWGYQMLANWLAVCGDAEAPGSRGRHGPADVGALNLQWTGSGARFARGAVRK